MQTPHVPPFFEQCLQYLQFLHALQFFEPVQVAFKRGLEIVLLAKIVVETVANKKIVNNFFII